MFCKDFLPYPSDQLLGKLMQSDWVRKGSNFPYRTLKACLWKIPQITYQNYLKTILPNYSLLITGDKSLGYANIIRRSLSVYLYRLSILASFFRLWPLFNYCGSPLNGHSCKQTTLLTTAFTRPRLNFHTNYIYTVL